MRAVTYQSPGEVRVEEKPDPEVGTPDEAVVRVEATGVCGSDLHLYHGRIQIEPGFTLGHEYVGTVVATGDDVTSVSEGDRVLGAFLTACGECFFCRAELPSRCSCSRASAATTRVAPATSKRSFTRPPGVMTRPCCSRPRS